MTLVKILVHLERERDGLDGIIRHLEELAKAASPPSPPRPKLKRGRKFMSSEDRAQVSLRMKDYWAKRRAANYLDFGIDAGLPAAESVREYRSERKEP